MNSLVSAVEPKVIFEDQFKLGPALACSPQGQPKVIFRDQFKGKLGEGWSWLRENNKMWRFSDDALEIRVVPGKARTVKNALVRSAPDRREGKFWVEVTVTNLTKPTQQYEQAGITWYSGGKPVIKLVKEQINGKTWIIPGKVLMESKTVELQLIVTADSYIAKFRPDGKGDFKTAAKGRLPSPNKDQVSIQCYDGPPDAEHWIRFDNFRLTKIPK